MDPFLEKAFSFRAFTPEACRKKESFFLTGGAFIGQCRLTFSLFVRSSKDLLFEKGLCAMTKSELIARLAERNPHLYLRDVERIVDTVFEEITQALAEGDRVELRGFGAFSVKHREARTGRNPRTGAAVSVEAKRLPFFKTGKGLRERLNGQESS